MSKPFAKKFYKSAAWTGCREAYVSERIRIDGGLCERCRDQAGAELHHVIPLTPNNINDANITVNWDNLKWLCKDCHFIEHRKLILEKFEKARRAKKTTVRNGFYFDSNGEWVRMSVYIVWGSPASGKTTLVSERMTPGDLVVDLDNLKQAISLQPTFDAAPGILKIALSLRDYLYELIAARAVDCPHVWIIATLPRRSEREELAAKLDAELIHCPADYHECIRRAGEDNSRRDKTLQRAMIDKYFEQYEP